MSLLDRLERWWRPLTIPHLTEIILAGQILIYILSMQDPALWERLVLVSGLVTQGEFWRLLTFPFLPSSGHPILFILGCMAFYFIGRTMEANWGTTRYNMYLGIGYVITVAASFLFPEWPTGNAFLGTSVFLAFAYHFPDVTFRIYFILPIKARWLAYVTWGVIAYSVYHGPNPVRVIALAGVANFFIFHTVPLLQRLRGKARQAQVRAADRRRENTAVHCCTVCGVTEKMDPAMEFRYCSQCAGSLCYCSLHLRDHVHRTEADAR